MLLRSEDQVIGSASGAPFVSMLMPEMFRKNWPSWPRSSKKKMPKPMMMTSFV